MSDGRLLTSDPWTGKKTTWHDEGEEGVVVNEVEDVQAIVDINKGEFASHRKHRPYGEFDKLASIPPTIYFKLVRDGIADDEKRFAAWLNDPDNRVFRTRPGTV